MNRIVCAGLMLALVACAPQEPPPGKDLEALRGQWVLVNYWAQWCKPCIDEIPELNEMNSKYTNVTVLGVNFDGATGEELAQQTEALGVEFTNLEQDPAAALGVPRPVVLPSTLVVNPAGELVTTLLGPQTLASLEQATVLASGE